MKSAAGSYSSTGTVHAASVKPWIGDYWIVVQSRYKDEPNLIRCRRRIKVL